MRMNLEKPKKPSSNAKLRKASVILLLAYYAAVFVIMTVGVEGTFWYLNRSGIGTTKPFLLDTSQLGKGKKGIRQVGNTTKMSYLDPHLGYAHDPETDLGLSEDGAIPGFVIFGAPGNEDALRIVALGGSTTDPLDRGNWPRALQNILAQEGIDAIVYNGGVAGYSSNQELFKLIRDAISLKPDIVVSLNGINDLGFLHSLRDHPMVHPYQSRVLRSVVEKKPPLFLPNTMSVLYRWRERSIPENSRVEGIHYGPEIDTSPPEQWVRNVRMSHAVAAEFGIEYLCFLQPVLGIGRYNASPDDDVLLEDANEAQHGRYIEQMAEFYDAAVEACDRLPFAYPLLNAFDGKTNMYRDARHPNADGYGIIARAIYDELVAQGSIDRIREARKRENFTVLSSRPSYAGDELVVNGSFENWKDELPVGWKLSSGSITMSRKATHGENSLRIEPPPRTDDDDTSRIQCSFKHGASVAGRVLHVAIDAKAPGASQLGFTVYGIVGGEQRVLTTDAQGKPGWVNHPGNDEWLTLSNDIVIPVGIRQNSLRLVVMLWTGAKEPAYVDNVSAMLSP